MDHPIYLDVSGPFIEGQKVSAMAKRLPRGKWHKDSDSADSVVVLRSLARRRTSLRREHGDDRGGNCSERAQKGSPTVEDHDATGCLKDLPFKTGINAASHLFAFHLRASRLRFAALFSVPRGVLTKSYRT